MAAQVAICRSNSAASPMAQLKWIACVLCAIFRARTKREALMLLHVPPSSLSQLQLRLGDAQLPHPPPPFPPRAHQCSRVVLARTCAR